MRHFCGAEERACLAQAHPRRSIADLTAEAVRFALKLALPLASFSVSAGFPSPADDYLEGRLDLNEYFIRHPAAKFFVKVSGDSKRGAGIFDGDLLIVDCAVACADGSIVVARLGDEFTLNRILKKGDGVFLGDLPAQQPIRRQGSPCQPPGELLASAPDQRHRRTDPARLPGSHRHLPPGIRYHKCGVMLTELTPDADHQDDFLDTRDTTRSKQLMATLDAINRRVDRNTVFYAASGVKRNWAMAATMKSRHFTADWQRLLRVTTR